MNDAGKVAFTPRGTYLNSETYEYLDTVVYDGNAYTAKKITTGNAPQDPDNEYWALLARGGESVPLATKERAGIVRLANAGIASKPGTYALDAVQANKSVSGTLARNISLMQEDVNEHRVKLSGVADGATKSPISNSTAITATGTHALDAVEKNASVSGTLAHQISELNTKLSLLSVTDITVTTNPNFPISVYSCVKYGKLVVFSFAVMAGEIGPYKTMAQLQGVTSRNTVFSAVTCYGGADAEVSIGAGSNTVAFSSSKLGGQAKGELIFICN